MLYFNSKCFVACSTDKAIFSKINLCILRTVMCLQTYFANADKFHNIFYSNMNSRYLSKFVHLNKNLKSCNLFTGIHFSSDSLKKKKTKQNILVIQLHEAPLHQIRWQEGRGSNEASRTDPLTCWSLCSKQCPSGSPRPVSAVCDVMFLSGRNCGKSIALDTLLLD